MQNNPQKPAIFLDRDDTLIVDTGYIHSVADFQWRKGSDKALACFQQADIAVFIITNQGGIARGYFTEQQMHEFHAFLKEQAIKSGGRITDIAFCPHHPLALSKSYAAPCACRKPAAGMIYQLAKKWNLDLSCSVVIGDRQTDIEAGKLAGCHTLLLEKTTSLAELAPKAIAWIKTQTSLAKKIDTRKMDTK